MCFFPIWKLILPILLFKGEAGAYPSGRAYNDKFRASMGNILAGPNII